MWTVVYMAQNRETANRLEAILTGEGILVKIRPISKNPDQSDSCFEILVPEAEVEEAHGVMIEQGF